MQIKPYTKTEWRDHIIDIISGNVVQEGTRFTAQRANNIEDGIFNMYLLLEYYRDQLQKQQVQIDMFGRAPANNGTFFDTLDGGNSKQLTRLTSEAVAQAAVTAGATTIKVDTVPFSVGENVTIFDDVSQETVKVIAIASEQLTVSALTNAYKKGARISRSNSVADTARQRLLFGAWGNYNVAITEVV
ncbi:hypothetical protein [Sporosarcina sp. SAFN-015]|uniref:hypothetical protein n=1 Tax=Sporosarcina sp. SAFN-015 TaxID=3387274 RepID=UPI003F805CD0